MTGRRQGGRHSEESPGEMSPVDSRDTLTTQPAQRSQQGTEYRLGTKACWPSGSRLHYCDSTTKSQSGQTIFPHSGTVGRSNRGHDGKRSRGGRAEWRIRGCPHNRFRPAGRRRRWSRRWLHGRGLRALPLWASSVRAECMFLLVY